MPQDQQHPVLAVLHPGKHDQGQAEQVVVNAAPVGKLDVGPAHLGTAASG